jgi:hypothetical protein
MHEFERIKKYKPLVDSLYNVAKENLGFKPHVKIVIMKNKKNATNPLGKTAYYSPSEFKIALYTQGRHIKDILRSLSHELVHHNQNCRGDFDGGAATVEGYAQEDGHLREMEREAYEKGNMIFRDWEDNLKKKGDKTLLMFMENEEKQKQEEIKQPASNPEKKDQYDFNKKRNISFNEKLMKHWKYKKKNKSTGE